MLLPAGLAAAAVLSVVLPSAVAVRRLPADAASARPPVVLDAVVTYCNPASGELYLQDATAGVNVRPHPDAKELRPGDRVRLVGRADLGMFAPELDAAAVVKVGPGRPPEPAAYNLDLEGSRWVDAQWVQADGVIEGVIQAGRPWIGRLRGGAGEATVVVPGGPGTAADLNALVGRPVRVRGVCVPSYDRDTRTVSGPPQILVQNPRFVAEVAAGPDPAGGPPRAIADLAKLPPSVHPAGRRAKVAGVVTGVFDRTRFFVQDATGGAVVQTEADADLTAGDAAEVVGGVRFAGRRPMLVGAAVRVTGRAAVPDPVPRTAVALAAGEHVGTVAAVEADLVDTRTDDRLGYVLTLADGAQQFEALLPPGRDPGPLADMEPGCRVRAAGAVGIHRSLADGGSGFLLLLRSPDDVTVLGPPPGRAAGRAAAAVAVLAAVAAVAVAGLAVLRRQVARQTAQIRDQFARQAGLEERLRQAQKLEAVGRLAGGIAHEFNNLLTVIGGCGELLAHNLPAGSAEAGLAADIRSAADRMSALTAQLQLFGRQRPVAVVPLDLSAAAADAARVLGRVVGEAVRVDCRPAAGLPPVRADLGMLNQILLNLAANARDAMPAGGTLSITTGAVRGPGGEVSAVRLTVADTGCGMTEAVQARIFEPFFTTKGLGEGTGLGLAAVYGMVQALGGEIRVRSAEGQGATFEIDLPAADGPVPAAPPAPPATGARVMVVEDDPAVRAVACQALAEAGYRVRVADGPAEALMLVGEAERIDVLVTDVVMPGMGGPELADVVRRGRPGLPVLYMSGYPAEEVEQRGVAASAVAFLPKPFTPAGLAAQVGEVLAGRAELGRSRMV